MNIQRIKIYDKIEDTGLIVNFIGMDSIPNGKEFYWSILYLYGMPLPGEGGVIMAVEEQVSESEDGFFISWEDLKLLSAKYSQIYEITVIGCKNKNLLCRFKNEDEMYRTSDITIELFDYPFWEIHSKDASLIEKLSKSFRDVELC